MTTDTESTLHEEVVVLEENEKPDVFSADEEDSAVYRRFTKLTKIRITFIISICSLALEFSIFAFLPSIATISKELDISHAAVNVTVSVFL